MNTDFTVTTTPVVKNIITISRRQLWLNFVNSWRDMVWGDFSNFRDCSLLKEAGETLCEGELNWKVRELFRAGHTFMLMGDAMQFIDDGKDTIPEIVVVDGDKRVVVDVNDIQY